jgi:hypothetical protein
MSFPLAPGLEKARNTAVAIQKQIIDRAKASGSLREDFSPEDVIYLLLANGVFVAATSGINENAWKRYVGLFLDACRADSATPLPALALTPEEALRTLLGLSPLACRESR